MQEEDTPDLTLQGDLNVARHCARCGAVRYVSIEETTDAGSLCLTCRTGNVPAPPPKRRSKRSESSGVPAIAVAIRDSLRSRSVSGNSAASAAQEGTGVEVASSVVGTTSTAAEPGHASDDFRVVRAGGVAPTFTAERKPPNLRIIVPALLVCLTMALGIGAFLARDRTEIPNTPAGERLEWMMVALNDSSVATVPVIQEEFSAWAIEEFGSRGIIAEIRAWDQRHDEYRIGRISEDERHRVVVLITTESMEWGELTIEVEARSPNEIRRFTIGPADPPR